MAGTPWWNTRGSEAGFGVQGCEIVPGGPPGIDLIDRAAEQRLVKPGQAGSVQAVQDHALQRADHLPGPFPELAGYHQAMGMRNYLVEGGSGTGKTSVCKELRRRGYHAINGDNELAYQGDPATGEPTDGLTHEHHIWHVDKVRAIIASPDEAVTFFCGGSRNFSEFIDLMDGVFVLEVDLDTLNRRLDERCRADPADWGGRPGERELIVALHQTREDVPPDGTIIDATPSIACVVDEILRHSRT